MGDYLIFVECLSLETALIIVNKANLKNFAIWTNLLELPSLFLKHAHFTILTLILMDDSDSMELVE